MRTVLPPAAGPSFTWRQVPTLHRRCTTAMQPTVLASAAQWPNARRWSLPMTMGAGWFHRFCGIAVHCARPCGMHDGAMWCFLLYAFRHFDVQRVCMRSLLETAQVSSRSPCNPHPSSLHDRHVHTDIGLLMPPDNGYRPYAHTPPCPPVQWHACSPHPTHALASEPSATIPQGMPHAPCMVARHFTVPAPHSRFANPRDVCVPAAPNGQRRGHLSRAAAPWRGNGSFRVPARHNQGSPVRLQGGQLGLRGGCL